jgi:hypothetical protein
VSAMTVRRTCSPSAAERPYPMATLIEERRFDPPLISGKCLLVNPGGDSVKL